MLQAEMTHLQEIGLPGLSGLCLSICGQPLHLFCRQVEPLGLVIVIVHLVRPHLCIKRLDDALIRFLFIPEYRYAPADRARPRRGPAYRLIRICSYVAITRLSLLLRGIVDRQLLPKGGRGWGMYRRYHGHWLQRTVHQVRVNMLLFRCGGELRDVGVRYIVSWLDVCGLH